MSNNQITEVQKIAKDQAEMSATIAVGKKMNITYGLLLTIIGLFISFIFLNGNKISRIEQTVTDFIKSEEKQNAEFRQDLKELAGEQSEFEDVVRQYDRTYLEKFDEIADNQSAIFWELNSLNPDFERVVVRGSSTNVKR